MVCAYCGASRPDDASFCPTCGKTVVPLGGTLPGTSSPTSAVIATPEVAFFNVGSTKLALMTVATFGLYPIYWLYKNWSVESELSGSSVVPALRAFFAPLFVHSLGVRIQDRAISMGISSKLRPGMVAIAFVLLTLATRLPDPFWMIGVLTGWALIPIQNEVARINAARAIGAGKEARYSVVNIVWLVVAAGLWLLVLAGLFLPEVE